MLSLRYSIAVLFAFFLLVPTSLMVLGNAAVRTATTGLRGAASGFMGASSTTTTTTDGFSSSSSPPCEGLVGVAITDVSLKKEMCQSHGFTYDGELDVFVRAFSVDDPTLVYYEGFVKPDGFFQISAAADDSTGLPTTYNMTTYACDDAPCDASTILQSLMVDAPCGAHIDVASLPRTSDFQLTFTASLPAMLQCKLEVVDNKDMKLNSLVVKSSASSGHTFWDLEALRDVETPTIDFPLTTSSEWNGGDFVVEILAELVDSFSGRQCLVGRTTSIFSTSESATFLGGQQLLNAEVQ